MFRRLALLAAVAVIALCPILLSGQAAPPQYYVFCAAQAAPQTTGGVWTVYYSGIMQGPAASLQNFQKDFTQFLMQRFSYRGGVSCAPTNSMVNAQTAMNNQMTAYRNAKRNVVQTGWTESAGALAGAIKNPLAGVLGGSQPAASPAPASAAPAAPAAAASTSTAAQPAAASTAATPKPAAAAGGGTGSQGGNQAGSQNSVATVFGDIFGTSGGSGGAAGAKPAQGQTAGQTGAKAAGGTAASGGGGNASPYSQVSNSLTSIFGNKSGGGGNAGGGGANGARGGQPGGGNAVVANNGASGQPGAGGNKGGQPGATASNGSLGSAQSGTTKLDVLGCGRQDLQVACITQLTNLNAKDTLVKTTDVWKDAFIVDDRGDRHTLTKSFFLNIDGEQRPQLDISNGSSAQFILMFDMVQAKVQKVALRSQTGGMDVENIGLVAADGSASSTAAAPAQH